MHDQVYAELKTALMEAKFEPGTRLSLRNLAAMFGVSVVPVRAALLRLMAEKAIEQSAKTTGHFNVPQLTMDEFDEIVQLRSLLEGFAAEQAAALISQSTVKSLLKMAERLQIAADKKDAKEYLRLNRDFKFEVIEAAEGPVLMQLIESLWVRMGPIMHLYAKELKQNQNVDNYFEIAEALENRDGETARNAMAEDVKLGASFLRGVAEFA